MNKEFENIVEIIAKFKGLTKKTTERLLVDLINQPEKNDQFLNQLIDLKQNFSVCPVCFFISYKNICEICANLNRKQNLICVVSSILDAINIEKYKKYSGLYAILGGEINLTKNIAPENLKIAELFKRVNENTELILALNATFEGEVTANYLAKIADKQKIKVSRLAKGIPVGGMLDYMDEETLENAFNNRK